MTAGTPAPGAVRVNRLLAGRGVSSRRGADALVSQGRVRVNGRPAQPGQMVDPRGDRVTVDGRELPPPVPVRTLMVNKPVGVVCTRSDPRGRTTVIDLVDDPSGLAPVGRLDADSRGLLLLSSDGDLALHLTHPRYGVEKRYQVTVAGHLPAAALRALMDGVDLSDGPARALRVRRVRQAAGMETLEVVMGEGRWREVRRMFAAVGVPVVDLCRVGLGPLSLGRLQEGMARTLRPAELAALRRAANAVENDG